MRLRSPARRHLIGRRSLAGTGNSVGFTNKTLRHTARQQRDNQQHFQKIACFDVALQNIPGLSYID